MFRGLLCFFVSIALIATAVSCKKEENTVDTINQNQVNSIVYKPAEKASGKDDPIIIDIVDLDMSEISEPDDTEIDFLGEVQGYWIRPDGYEHIHDENNMPDELIINAQTKKWKPFGNGNFDTELDCYADEQGIDFTMEDGSVIEDFAFDGTVLLNHDGSVAYVRVDDIPQ